MKKENATWRRYGWNKTVILRCDPLCDASVKDIEKEVVLMFNDCRNNINAAATVDDKHRENAHFETFQRNFWPYIAVVTDREIVKEEEVCICYSNEYASVSHESIDWFEDVCKYTEHLTKLHNKNCAHS